MNLPELRTFLAIVETGSLVRASQQLHVTQSTVTARLKSLEEELGQTLINRQKSGASLTAAGVRLHRYAETIAGLWSQARQEIALPGAFDAVCNIACHPDLWPARGALLFEAVRVQQPSVALSVWLGGAGEMSGWLDSGLSDIALTYAPSARATQSIYALPSDQICLVSSDPNALVKSDPGYIFVEAGEEFGRWHAATYADASAARLAFGTAQLGLDHLLTHGGSAYLPLRMAEPYLAEQRLHRLDAPEYQRDAWLVVNRSAEQVWDWFAPLLADQIT